MHEISGLRLIRQLRGLTLADVAKAVDVQRSHISEVERTLDAGRKLQKRLAEFHGAPWSLLSKTIDASKIADALIAQLTPKKVTITNA
jgi:transcriptional regulator with XRE-family HTH domain